MRRSERRPPRRSKPTATSRSTQRGMKANAKSPTWWLRLSERLTSTWPRSAPGREEIAANHVAAVEADIAEQVKRAKDEARKAHTKAEQAIERARDQMKQARELAEAAAEAARRAADEARARAERLSDEADADAAAAQRKVDEANERREAVASEGRKLGDRC